MPGLDEKRICQLLKVIVGLGETVKDFEADQIELANYFLGAKGICRRLLGDVLSKGSLEEISALPVASLPIGKILKEPAARELLCKALRDSTSAPDQKLLAEKWLEQGELLTSISHKLVQEC